MIRVAAVLILSLLLAPAGAGAQSAEARIGLLGPDEEPPHRRAPPPDEPGLAVLAVVAEVGR